MSDVRALRLRLTAPEGWTARAQARTEEALRLAAADDNRLVVMRRLDLGRLPVMAHPAVWQARTAERMAALTRGAVHAATADAARADAVWFASAAEARALLLTELAAGRLPFGWFWRLAVPDWNGATLPDWLASELAVAARDPQRLAELAQAVVRIAAAGHLATLAAALPGGTITLRPSSLATSGGDAATGAPATSSATLLDAEVRTLLERLPAAARQAFRHELRQQPPASRAASVLARLALVAAAPELGGRRTMLAELADIVTGMEGAAPVEDPGPRQRQAAAERPKVTRPKSANADQIAGLPGPSRTIDATDVTEPARERVDLATPIDPPLPDYRPEQASAAAGLWLLVRPLAWIGFDDWLATHPDLAAAGFARGFLRHVAERQRSPPDDPLFALLPEAVRPIDPALFDMWRIGLDRWLRRRTRRTLAKLVKRGGWLSPHETGVRVRFRLDQADIALRVRALDVDPGWVPWLGMAIAYDYRDEALR